MAGRAAREWDISDDQRAKLVDALLEIATTSPKERNRISAGRELSRMVSTNVAAEPKTTQTFNMNKAFEQRKRELQKRIEAEPDGSDDES